MRNKRKKSFNWYGLRQRFSIRKYHFGAASVLIGTALVFAGGQTAQANEQASSEPASALVKDKTEGNGTVGKTESNQNTIAEKPVVPEKETATTAAATPSVESTSVKPEVTTTENSAPVVEKPELVVPETTGAVVEKPAETPKEKAEENLRNVTADQNSKQKALEDALNIQKQKQAELSKAKNNANRAQKEYDDALKACKDKHEDLNKIIDNIQSLNKKKKDMEDKVAKLAENEKELIIVKTQLQDIVSKLINLLQTQTKLNDELQKLISELKDLENEYNHLLEIYTKERMQEPPIALKPFIDIKEELKEEDVVYKTIEQNDPTLEEGKRVVKIKGKKGRKSIKTITLSENGKVLDVLNQKTILEDVVDEVVLVGTKKPGDNLGSADTPKSVDKTPGSLNNQPTLQRPSVNSNGLNTLPNTGESQSGMATVAGLVALAVAARLKRKDKQNQ